MLTVPEAARRTGFAPETIRRWIRAGKLPARKVGTQHVIDERDLDAIASRAVGEPSAPYEIDTPARDRGLARRIAVDDGVLSGKPIIRGTRLSVALVLELLAAGWTPDEILDNYPGVELDDVRACIAYAASMVEAERVYPVGRRS